MASSSFSSATPDIPPEVLDQAIDWVVKLRSGTSNETMQSDFQIWLRADPIYQAAWHELQAAEQDFGKLTATPHALAFRTLEAVQENRKTLQGRRKALRLLGFGATSIALGALTVNNLPLSRWTNGIGANYATGIGEHKTVTLADGTQIRLNTDTAIDVSFNDARRTIIVHQGEVFIQTGKDNGTGAGRRPFWVQTAHSHLEALGTQFFVHQQDAQTRLLVTEGRVAIQPKSKNVAAIAEVGDEFLIHANGSTSKVLADHDALDTTGWLDGAIVTKQMRLADVLTELSRYRQGWLRCDPAVADLKVSGVFQIDDTDQALDALVRTLPVRIEKHTRYWVTLVPA